MPAISGSTAFMPHEAAAYTMSARSSEPGESVRENASTSSPLTTPAAIIALHSPML